MADMIESNIDELAALESLDNGKPLAFAKGDIGFGINILRYYAGWTDKIHGQTIPISGPYLCYTKEEPVGVCGQIVPWNFPFLMAVFKIAPALATGNTIVLKPAENTPLTAIRLGDIAMECGLPEGVLNVLPGFGGQAGEALVRSKLVDKIAFTGSTAVGKHILMNGGIKRVTLELGGKNPLIVMNDADLDLAVGLSHFAAFYNSG
jgi:aldehyde dehydrogenase (NAD+)